MTPLTEEIHHDAGEISECRWMPVAEFLETQDHPLITAVLRRIYGLERGTEDAAAVATPSPIVEMLEAPVQWPNRQPYPTYFAANATESVED